jgi:protein SCO1
MPRTQRPSATDGTQVQGLSGSRTGMTGLTSRLAGMVTGAALLLATAPGLATADVATPPAGPAAGATTTAPPAAGATPPAAPAGAPAAGAAAADDPTDFIPVPPPTYQGNGVTVDEKLGNIVPLDTRFRDHTGEVVTLRQVMSDELPTILTFNYSDCPMLCSLQLNGLSAVLEELAKPTELGELAGTREEVGKKAVVQLGAQFRVITIVLEPKQAQQKTVATRESYLQRLPDVARPLAERGWTFLSAADPNDARAIAAVADSVGFRYTYIPDRAEWAHPAALIFLSSAGTVTRYVYGTQFEAAVVRESIVKAGLAEPSTAVGFMNRCYHFDPDANNHAQAGVWSLRIGGAAFLGLMILAFVGRRFRRQPRDPGVIQA